MAKYCQDVMVGRATSATKQGVTHCESVMYRNEGLTIIWDMPTKVRLSNNSDTMAIKTQLMIDITPFGTARILDMMVEKPSCRKLSCRYCVTGVTGIHMSVPIM